MKVSSFYYKTVANILNQRTFTLHHFIVHFLSILSFAGKVSSSNNLPKHLECFCSSAKLKGQYRASLIKMSLLLRFWMVTSEELGGQGWGLWNHRRRKHPACPLLTLRQLCNPVVTEMLAEVRGDRRDDTKAAWKEKKAICRICRIVWPEERQLRNKRCLRVFNSKQGI